MMRIEHVGVVFNPGTPDENRALKDVSLDVRKGDFLTVIGSNGAGKTTLYNVIAGTYAPTSGHIFVRDIDVTRTREYKRARYIGRIFQNPLLGTAGKMSLEDNMVICHKKGYKGLKISLNSKLRAYFRERLRELDMGLENRLADNVDQFSGGQRQALTLLMAILNTPKLLLLDEHTAALDPKTARKVLELSERFIADMKLTCMMVTHNMRDAIVYGNRLIMMSQGRIILDVNGTDKQQLTVEQLIHLFSSRSGEEVNNDRMLLG